MGDNRIVNGNFAINQRGYVSNTALPASPVTAAYGHDRWKAGAAGCTYTFVSTVPDTTVTVTVGTLTQIIEGGVIEGGVYVLSWTGTAQARVWQGTPAGSYAASPVVTASLTAGANTTVEFNTGSVGKVKLEIGNIATPFNRQSLAKSTADCMRYYWASGILIASGYGAAGAGLLITFSFPVQMRAAPTVVLTSINYSNSSTLTSTSQYGGCFNVQNIVTALGSANATFQALANAEL